MRLWYQKKGKALYDVSHGWRNWVLKGIEIKAASRTSLEREISHLAALVNEGDGDR
jgi:hypothetical protein